MEGSINASYDVQQETHVKKQSARHMKKISNGSQTTIDPSSQQPSFEKSTATDKQLDASVVPVR